ncbi:glycosyltransferase [Pseudodonghicola flavimaris]|uniref:Glycosyltransferase n=1 Tax=Pseudodonghicola flavimaris TaxID=3050036 RepID=A0ABT7EZ33_9RHOB|nr:glycosyltransferase [Pseudodonghicola flavimaris]MDK3017606.1 glycosyltransferase [Pseudodonghicola flavimaris]
MQKRKKIAFIESWPNLAFSAEREFLKRFLISCSAIDVDCRVVVTSDEINDYNPDVVLCSHEFSRKITGHPTLGVMWSPPEFFENDPYRLKSIMSYDGYLVGSSKVAQFLDDLWFSTGTNKLRSSFRFLPSSPKSSLSVKELRSLFYAGVHWDGARHNGLFSRLSQKKVLDVYGPKESWSDFAEAHRGTIPLDGKSMFNRICESGVALAVHKAAHRRANTPSMRLFEAASVGASIISDNIPFAREVFGDTIHIIDSGDLNGAGDEILHILDGILTNPKIELERAAAAREIFERDWSLDVLIPKVLEFSEDVSEAEGFTRRPVRNLSKRSSGGSKKGSDLVSIIVRTGGRNIDFLKRSLNSLYLQSYRPLEAVVVDYKGRDDVKDLCSLVGGSDDPEFNVTYLTSPNNGFRSTPILKGATAARGGFIGLLDDDDTIHTNCIATLINRAHESKKKFVYGGVVKFHEDGDFVTAPNFNGPLGEIIEERRELHFFDPFNRDRFFNLDNFIQSNTWICDRKTFLNSCQQADPELEVAEDVYFYGCVLQSNEPAFTYRVASQWHWRSGEDVNSMTGVGQDVWGRCANRVKGRWKFFDENFQWDSLPYNAWSGAEEDEDPAIKKSLRIDNPIVPTDSFVSDYSARGFAASPEGDGIWITERNASIRFGCIASREFGVKINFIPFYAPGAERVVLHVSCTGAEDLTFPVMDGNASEIFLEIQGNAHEEMEMQFSFNCMHSPQELGISDDARMLGIFVRSIELVELGLPGSATPRTIPLEEGGGKAVAELSAADVVNYDREFARRYSVETVDGVPESFVWMGMDENFPISVELPEGGPLSVSVRIAFFVDMNVFEAFHVKVDGRLYDRRVTEVVEVGGMKFRDVVFVFDAVGEGEVRIELCSPLTRQPAFRGDPRALSVSISKINLTRDILKFDRELASQ